MILWTLCENTTYFPQVHRISNVYHSSAYHSTWQPLHPLTAGTIATGDLDNNGEADVLIDFPGFGLWVYRNNGENWEQLHPFSPELVTTGNIDNDSRDEVIVDFGPGFGIWIFRNNTAWDGAPLHGLSPDHLDTANIDGN